MPLLFVYGEDKPFPFHSQKWIDHVTRTGGEVVALGGGQWVQKHPAFNGILSGFRERTERAV